MHINIGLYQVVLIIFCFCFSMGVDKDTRTEVLHLLGTDNMKTLDIFSYFSGYSPASIEWISDKSCNVVWLDEEACANAFKKRSVKIKGLSVETDDLVFNIFII